MAEPLLSGTFARVVVPDLNAREPIGTPESVLEVTVAVNVTDWPYSAGFGLELNVVVVAKRLTTWLNLSDVLLR